METHRARDLHPCGSAGLLPRRRIEAGKIADLVLIDGNPLEDISALASVSIVVVGGAVVEM